ncbi:hypothetical protein [Alkalibacillus haloalkaliphilus]|uniref:hypothetical protein n=1 Tax=Alkalibacillus haloalkaliphilus TaxID=94136 RepID=UPI000368C4EC|nr:hypothetical protein [Alkalibacillus haloalkaliphilus]
MRVFVYPCFDQFGYQLVNYYLNSGVEVVGSGSLETEDEMFYFAMVGRNSNFNFVEGEEVEQREPFDQAFLIGEDFNVNAKQIFKIATNKNKNSDI